MLRDLAHAGLVEAAHGTGGGCRFSGNAKRITLYQVVEMFEDITASRSARFEVGDDSEGHIFIGHIVCGLVEEILFGEG